MNAANVRANYRSSGVVPRPFAEGFASRMVVSHVKHRNMSKSESSSRDLAVCIATRQIGQWRMTGRRDDFMGNSLAEFAILVLIQIKADAARTALAASRRRASG
jgi:hypothetical protein